MTARGQVRAWRCVQLAAGTVLGAAWTTLGSDPSETVLVLMGASIILATFVIFRAQRHVRRTRKQEAQHLLRMAEFDKVMEPYLGRPES